MVIPARRRSVYTAAMYQLGIQKFACLARDYVRAHGKYAVIEFGDIYKLSPGDDGYRSQRFLIEHTMRIERRGELRDFWELGFAVIGKHGGISPPFFVAGLHAFEEISTACSKLTPLARSFTVLFHIATT